jgi:enamine deaminase RidA (YjgF/YER057c/UK114 family)
MPRQHIQPDALSKRIVNGHVLYSHVVAVEGRRLIFISGQLARDQQGNVVGKGDMICAPNSAKWAKTSRPHSPRRAQPSTIW